MTKIDNKEGIIEFNLMSLFQASREQTRATELIITNLTSLFEVEDKYKECFREGIYEAIQHNIDNEEYLSFEEIIEEGKLILKSLRSVDP